MFSKRILIGVLVFVFSVSCAFAQSAAKDFYALTRAAPVAYKAGNIAEATTLAKALLADAPQFKADWNYANAVHVGHLILGRAALASGDVKEAKRQLLASAEEFGAGVSVQPENDSGGTPKSSFGAAVYRRPYKSSPQMDTFGPDMQLAKELLEKGEKETVIKYLDLCSAFWNKEFSKVDSWKSVIERGEMPDFGPNLIYFFN